MALDVGSKTIGVALSDPLKVIVRPLLTLKRVDLEQDGRRLLQMILEQHVERVILGLPRHLGGEESEMRQVVQPLADYLQAHSSVVVEWMDERLSTKEAEELMKEAHVEVKARRRRRNEFAAAVILKRYMQERST